MTPMGSAKHMLCGSDRDNLSAKQGWAMARTAE